MSPGSWFWIIYVIVFLFGGFIGYRDPNVRPYFWPGIVVWVLIGLLGWGIFGPPIR